MPIVEKKTKHPYVIVDAKISGGQPVIGGTRIKVMDIAIRYELMGWTPDRIVDEYPHLKLAQVHDALSYYYANKTVLDKKYREGQAVLAQIRKKYPSKLKARVG